MGCSNYDHTMNADVLVHAWAQTTTYWGHSQVPQTARSERIMSKNVVFLSTSAVGCKSAKMESNRRLANDLCGLWTPSTVPAGERFHQNFSHMLKHLQHQRIKSLFCTWLWRACACTRTAFERSTREGTSPLKPSSFCDANAPKRRWPSTFLRGVYATLTLKCPSSHTQTYIDMLTCAWRHTQTRTRLERRRGRGEGGVQT